MVSETGGAGCDAGERRIRFAHGAPAQGHPIGEAARRFAVSVNRDLDGRVCVELVAAGAQATDDAALAALRAGEAEMAAPRAAALESLAPGLRIFDIPFLFKSRADAMWFQRSGAGQRLKRASDGAVKGLAFWNAGMTHLSAVAPITRPGALAGLRVADRGGALAGVYLERVGAERVEAPALRAALVGDAQSAPEAAAAPDADAAAVDADVLEATWPDLDLGAPAMRLGPLTETGHALAAHLVVVSAAFWEAAPRADQLALSQIMARVTAQSVEASAALEEAHRRALVQAGARIYSLSEEDRAAWEAAFEPLWREEAARFGQPLLDEALAARR
ncbi:MAG: TRAP transporter substrate-binding protein DctP [Pseudomonadota bacterium]